MQIKSDKEDAKNPGFFLRMWKLITDDLVATAIYIMLPIILYTCHAIFPDDYIWLLAVASGIVSGVGLITDGKLFSHIKDMIMVLYVSLGLVTVIFFLATPIETEESRLDLKPFITNVKADKEKTNFVIDTKLPFESGIKVYFISLHQYDALFSDSEHFGEFTIEVIKSCSIYHVKSVSCEVILEITHKDSSEILFTTTLTNSVFPKKLKIEMVE